jgi:hypothetical protein
MADESRTLATGGKDYSPLFSYIAGRNKVADTKELGQFQFDLDTQKQQAANTFTEHLEGIKQQNLLEREQQVHSLNLEDARTKGSALADYTGTQAVDQARGGNVIDSLVQRPANDLASMETGQPSFEAKPINPLAAEAAHKDLLSGIEAKRTSDLALRNATQQKLLMSIGPEEVSSARAMVPRLRTMGLDLDADFLDKAAPGSMTKEQFTNVITRAQDRANTISAQLERARVYSEARVEAANIAAQSREKIAQLNQKTKLTNQDLAVAREERKKIESLLTRSQARMTMLGQQLAAATTGPAIAKLQSDMTDEQSHYDNLSNTHGNMMQLETKAQLAPMPAGREVETQIAVDTRKALDSIGYKGKNINDVRPNDLPKLDAAMSAINPRYKRQQ